MIVLPPTYKIDVTRLITGYKLTESQSEEGEWVKASEFAEYNAQIEARIADLHREIKNLRGHLIEAVDCKSPNCSGTCQYCPLGEPNL